MTTDSYPKLDLVSELEDLDSLRTEMWRHWGGASTRWTSTPGATQLHHEITALARVMHNALSKIANHATIAAAPEIIVHEDDPGLDEDVAPRPTTTKVLTVAEYRLASMIAQLEPLTTQEEELTCAIESLRSAHRRICRIISDNEE